MPNYPTTKEQMQSIAWALKDSRSAASIKHLAQIHEVDESYVAAMAVGVDSGQFIFESVTDGKAGVADISEWDRHRLEDLAQRVNAAQSKPLSEASHQELEALAATFYNGR